jgi:FkbM family methyltransferase
MKYIYGGGRYGQALALAFDELGYVYQFLDQYMDATQIHGIPLLRPDQIVIKTEDTVYITALPAPKNLAYNAIIPDFLRELGFKNIMDVPDVFKTFPLSLARLCADGFMWRKSGKKVLVDEIACATVSSWLSDDRSRELFNNIIRFRQNPNDQNAIQPDIGEEYFPDDIPLLYSSEMINYIDLGAFNGDTMLATMSRIPERIAAYFAFEPDTKNFLKLQKTADSLSNDATNTQIICLPIAATSSYRILNFDQGKESASMIVSDGDNVVQGIDLSSMFFGKDINFIKVDVEGHDKEALIGAKDLIQRCRPVMAVSCYHRPEDLWEIPIMLSNYLPDSKFYFRQHGHWGLELTLYVIPESNSAH